MHRVVESHLNDFADDHNIKGENADIFEIFVPYILARKFSFDSIDPNTLVYEGADPGIDSIFYIFNDQFISTADEVEKLFKSKKNNYDVKCIFIQSKSSEKWDKGEINKFESATCDFISSTTAHDLGEHLKERKKVLEIILDNVGKLRNGRPDIACYYVTTASKAKDKEILAAAKTLLNRLCDSGLFENSSVELLGRDDVIKLWGESQGSYEAKFSVIGASSFPKSDGIEESYVCTLSAKEFVEKVLTDETGSLRKGIFDENVRDFIDFDDSLINNEILESLNDVKKKSRFGILNNGVTMISPDVRLQSNEIYVSNYQIVNGCQTSNVLFEGRNTLDKSATLMVKIVETDNQEIIDDVVRATNRQNKVEEYQFLATLKTVKAAERYFAARGGDEQHRLFFERRPNQFSGENIPSIRVFNLKEVARCTGAMFFDRPDLASRYPNVLVEDLHNIVFNPENKEEIFYASAYALYRLKLHHGNTRIDPIFFKLRWYALMALRYFLIKKPRKPTASRVEDDCKVLMDFVSKNDDKAMKKWDEIASRLYGLGEIDRDRLRTIRFVSEVRDAMLK